VIHVLWAILVTMFVYPNGIVLGNLIASAICSVLVYLKIHFKLNKQHAERLAQSERHHKAQLAAIRGVPAPTMEK
jgi:hypothetical protein